ncbi:MULTISPECIES: 2TM domain-containing protein [Aequorivita]|uniref:2TM domain-containing protein n=2 Tax=Aequorivita TaxID=153265 RepID=A0AB35YPH1_9FLAO|nr:2TM domain-containing protein [Aequorivita sp. Ant34-E75]WGF91785.1 2TM domain-containing protein [Aequorivita sp. Ant34-E75]
METQKSLAYLRAKKKVETLKEFYSHLLVYILINTGIILVSANVFNAHEIDFKDWSNYITAIFWGIGLLFHAVYVWYILKFNNNFLKRWEEKKMKQFLDDDL